MEPSAPGSPDATQTAPGSTSPTLAFGPYRLLQKLGEGGMGEVWLAEQTRPVRRQVALKIIKAGMDTADVVARFEAERQALALMDHPAIATVFDGGSTPEGRPYFAMEYVKGEPLTTYCDRQRLGTKDRLELFIQVCEGVQHAHQKGIIHRDLKPSNVLVMIQDDHTVPKIIDFGVAKATAQHLTERSLFTELGVLIGTPEYMSPEQAEMGRLDVDTRTDIYALGVLLYELLTGALPFDRKELRQAGIAEIQRIIREKEPPRPSTRITLLGPASTEAAQNRHTEPRRLISELRGDLDWITMRALEKDRTRRYQTASSLAVDVRRHLNNEPVSAGPPSAAYRARKFVRRNRLGVIAVATLLLLLAVFAGAMAVQAQRIARERNRANQERDRANQEAAQARKTLAFLTGTFEVANPRKGKGPSATATEIIDDATKKLNEMRGQPLLQASLLMTLSEIYDEMGLYEAAESPARSALEIREKALGPNHLDVAQSLNNLASIWRKQGKLEEAEPFTKRSLEIREKALGPNQPDVAQSLNNLAIIWWNQGRLSEAEPLLRRSLKIREEALGPNHPDVAISLNNLATLYAGQGKLAEAEPLYRGSLEIWEKALGANHPDVATSLNNLATLYVDQGKLSEAEPLLKRSLEIRERALGPNHPDVAMSLNNIADLYRDQGKFSEVEPLLKRSLAIKEKALGPNHPDAALALYNLGVLALQRKRRLEALAYMRRAIPRFAGTSYWALVDEDPDIASLRADPEFRRLVADVVKNAAGGKDEKK